MREELQPTPAASDQDPVIQLRAIRALRELTDRLEVVQVDNAREQGWSWQDIAARLGVSKQAAHKKHAHRERG